MDYEVKFKVKVSELGLPRYDSKDWNVIPKTGDFIKIGDPIVEVKFIRYYQNNTRKEVGNHTLYSDREGYFLNPQESLSWEREFKCYIFPSFDGLLSKHLFNYEITVDPYTSQKHIKWNRKGHLCSDEYRDDYLLVLTLYQERPCIGFLYRKSYKIKIKKSDSFIFLFEDNTTVVLNVLEKPHNCKDWYWSDTLRVFLPLTESEIEIFRQKKWKSIKIEHTNGDSPNIIENMNSHSGEDYYDYPLSGIIFQRYVEKYIQSLEESFIEWREHTINIPSQISEYSVDNFEGVYVYLMMDTSNGFYKIGISNNPEYRERTLQSEKPTIEKICCKKYPSREIARAIESALHTVYSAKHIRGEWFRLDEIDVVHLIETLK